MNIAAHGGNVKENSEKQGIYKNDILDFSSNINPLGIPIELEKAIIEGINELKFYPDNRFLDERKALANYHSVSPDNCLTGNGATEIIFLLMRALRPKKGAIACAVLF